MKNMTIIGISLGLLLALVAAIGGFGAFVLGIVLAAIGGVVGAHFDGLIDLRAFYDALASGRGGRG